MPVVEKLEKIKGIHVIISTGLLCEVFHFGKLIARCSSETKIQPVYDAVVAAINGTPTP